MPDENAPRPPFKIIDILALITGRKPRRYSLLDPLPEAEDEEPEPIRPRRRDEEPVPLTAEEAPHFSSIPLTASGAPHYRSQLACIAGERANVDAGRMKMFSFDDDINALHFIARYERAGVGHLAEAYRKQLAEHTAREVALGEPLHRVDRGRDYNSEELMVRKYGTPEEDRARIVQFHRRCAEMKAARQGGVPSRYSHAEPA